MWETHLPAYLARSSILSGYEKTWKQSCFFLYPQLQVEPLPFRHWRDGETLNVGLSMLSQLLGFYRVSSQLSSPVNLEYLLASMSPALLPLESSS